MRQRLSSRTTSAGRRAVSRRAGPADRPVRDPGFLRPDPTARWTFLTNHAHVLILLSKSPDTVLREVATRVGITERAVQRIIADLERDGFLVRAKVGRRNAYRIRADRPLRHPIESHRSIRDLIEMV